MEDFDYSSQTESVDPFTSYCQTPELVSAQQLPRVSTAPSCPLSDLDEFKYSKGFSCLEQIVVCSNHLIYKTHDKLDLDTEEGQQTCQKYLQQLQNMMDIYGVCVTDKSYRDNFSQAYRVLYKQGKLSYLTQILDSAQQAFPYLWVNSQKYLFSREVIWAGQKLNLYFINLLTNLRSYYGKLIQAHHQPNVYDIQLKIKTQLQQFDSAWSNFQKFYVIELMEIQKRARRLILEAIQIQKQLHSVEIRERLKGKILINCEDYMKKRKNLCMVIYQINQVTNCTSDGKQLHHQILCQAEGILRRVSRQQSKAIRLLAEKVRGTFTSIRVLLRKYQNNIQMVDPQLKNNPDLVQILQQYQKAWQKGQDYFLYPEKKKFLMHFSGIVQSLAQKYQRFNQLVSYSDADLFLIIPCILILRYLDNDDKHICLYFLPSLQQIQTKIFRMFFELEKQFEEWKKQNIQHYLYYNTIQKLIVGVELKSNQQTKYLEKQQFVDKMMFKIKNLASELHRAHPSEWNLFLEISLAGTAS